MEDTFQRPIVVQNVRLPGRKIFPLYSRRLGKRLVVCRHPVATPPTDDPRYPGISCRFRPTPG